MRRYGLSLIVLTAMLFSLGCQTPAPVVQNNSDFAARKPAEYKVPGQKFSCAQYQGTRLMIWVDGKKAYVQTVGKPTSYTLGGVEFVRGRNTLISFTADNSPANVDTASVDIDKRMVNGKWTKDVISNSAGTTVFPSLMINFATSDTDVSFDCDPGDRFPTY